LMIGSTLFIIYLVHIRALNAPYLWPFIPFNPQAISHVLIRRTVPGSIIRPSIVHPRDRFRQPPE
jgi:stage V sporulation protein AF